MTLAQAEAKVAEKAEVSRLVPEVVDPGEEEEAEAPKPAQVLPILL
jgi:predicted Ser/Thr protein kinase